MSQNTLKIKFVRIAYKVMPLMHTFFISSIILACLLAPAQAKATSLETIRTTALSLAQKAFPEDQHKLVKITPGKLDTRLQVKHCDQPLSSFFPNNQVKSGRVSIGVKCEGLQHWTVFVPMQIDVFDDVIAAKRNVQRHETLTVNDLTYSRQNIAKLFWGYYTNPEDVAGLISKRRIHSGSVITPTMVATRKIVNIGDKVRIEFHNSTVKITMSGEALSAGGFGEKIRVKNPSSGKILNATITAPGVVRVY